MAQLRKTGRAGEPSDGAAGRCTARSVVASTLLGVDPPRLPTRLLVRSGELFGISQGTTRVALSRMVAAGELVVDGNAHELAGRLLERQARQQASRVPRRRAGGRATGSMAVVTETRRPVAARAELRAGHGRAAPGRARARASGCDPTTSTTSWAAAGSTPWWPSQCRRFRSRPADEAPPTDRPSWPPRLWDLDGWDAGRVALRDELGPGRRCASRPATPPRWRPASCCPPTCCATCWPIRCCPPSCCRPDWPGDDLRADYDRYDRAFKDLWRDWFRREATLTGRRGPDRRVERAQLAQQFGRSRGIGLARRRGPRRVGAA